MQVRSERDRYVVDAIAESDPAACAGAAKAVERAVRLLGRCR
ncbi:hypothetical protein [Nocardia asiatica]